MKTKILYLFICLVNCNLFAQEKKETVYLLFNSLSNEKCRTNVEQTFKNKKGIKYINKYRKEFKKDKFIFYICDEKFLFYPKKQKIDTCNISCLKKLNFKSIDYIKGKYEKSNNFKHHTFKEINIVEKISGDKIVKYYGVYWCCEWSIE